MKTFTFLIILAAAPFSRSWGEEVRLTLHNIPAYAGSHNRDLKAAAFRIDEARGRLTQAGRLTNPELEFEHSRATRGKGHSTEIALEQRFPVTARLRQEKAVSRAQLAMAEAEFQEARRQILLKAKTSAVRWLSLQDRRAINARQIANSRELTRFLSGRVAAGEAPATDATLVELETRQLESELLQFDAEEAAVAGELKPLLGLTAKDSVVISGPLPPPEPTAGTVNPENRPDFQAARRQIEATRAEVALARSNRWEDVAVGLLVESGREEDDLNGMETENRVGIRLRVPLPLWNRNQGRIRETGAAAERAKQEAEALSASISAEVAAAHGEMGTLATLIREFDSKILPAAAQLEDQLRVNYSSGQVSLTEVLRARDRRLQLERQRSEALRDYHLARVREEAASGRILNTLTGTAKSSRLDK